MQHCTSGWETGAPHSGRGFLPGLEKENEHAQWSASYPGLDMPWRPLGRKLPSSCPLSFKVRVLEIDPLRLKCAVNFLFFYAKDGTPGLADSLFVPAQLVVPVFAPSVSVRTLDKDSY